MESLLNRILASPEILAGLEKSAAQMSTALRSFSKVCGLLAEKGTKSPAYGLDHAPKGADSPVESEPESDDPWLTPQEIAKRFLDRLCPKRKLEPTYSRIGMFIDPAAILFETILNGRKYHMNTNVDLLYRNGKRCSFNDFEEIMALSHAAYIIIDDEICSMDRKRHMCQNFATWTLMYPIKPVKSDLTPRQKKNKHIMSLHGYLKNQSKS
jgi:hypothetical protein